MVKRKFNKSNIPKLPANKPIIYSLETAGGQPNYIGVAKRGRVRQRLIEHLPSGPDPIPAKTVTIKQFSSVEKAKAAEKRAIKKKHPKYNIQNR